ncbi:anion permease [Myxococcota bacterium]|nr:anion permease [Myxococcota bacterium]MBU1899012.1 anion permease [Myxococcota bacterium]
MIQLKRALPLIGSLSLGLALWFIPAPEGLKPEAWRLFAVFAATITAIVIGALPILTASLLALAASVLTGLLSPKIAYTGFAQGFILLIVVAFLVAHGVVKSGLGRRLALIIIQRFGHSTLGLAYSMMLTDLLIAPAFPSNTARSGVLYPLVRALAKDSGSTPEAGTAKRLGAYLMMCSMAGLAVSSALWFTAMASNPIGAAMAHKVGVEISFGSWFLAASVPSLAAAALLPWMLYRLYPPTLKATPEAPAAARAALAEMGPMRRAEWVTALTFVSMVTLWALSELLGADKTAVAFAGLAVLMVAEVFTAEDMRGQGDALGTLIWFAILYTLSASLNELGFMRYLGGGIAGQLDGLGWISVYVSLTVIYTLIHYLFVSQTAHLLALFPVFLSVGIDAGVPGGVMALQLLFATNYNSVLTPQGSSANVLFVGSGYVTAREVYQQGAYVTLACLVIYLLVGTPWMLLIGV